MKLLNPAILTTLLFASTSVSKFIAYANEEAVKNLKLPIYDTSSGHARDAPTINIGLAVRADHDVRTHIPSATIISQPATILPTTRPSNAASGLRVSSVLTIPTILLKTIGSLPGAIAAPLVSEAGITASGTDKPGFCCEFDGYKKFIPCPGTPGLDLVTPVPGFALALTSTEKVQISNREITSDIYIEPRGIDSTNVTTPEELIESDEDIAGIKRTELNSFSNATVTVDNLIASSKAQAGAGKTRTCCFLGFCYKCKNKYRSVIEREGLFSFSDTTSPVEEHIASSEAQTTAGRTRTKTCCFLGFCYHCNHNRDASVIGRGELTSSSTSENTTITPLLVHSYTPISASGRSLRIPLIFLVPRTLSSLVKAQFTGQKCTDCNDPICVQATGSICPRLEHHHNTTIILPPPVSSGSYLRLPLALTFVTRAVTLPIKQVTSAIATPDFGLIRETVSNLVFSEAREEGNQDRDGEGEEEGTVKLVVEKRQYNFDPQPGRWKLNSKNKKSAAAIGYEGRLRAAWGGVVLVAVAFVWNLA